MAKLYMVFDNITDAQDFVDELDVFTGYPKDPGTHYTEAIAYFIGDKAMCLLDSRSNGFLTPVQTSSLKTLAEIISDGGFPVPVI